MSRPLEIRAWFNDGRTMEASFMLIIYDTLNGIDYPIFVADPGKVKEVIVEVVKAPMQRLLEVYNLNEDRNIQLNEDRTWRLPK